MPISVVCHDLSFDWPDGRTVLDGLDATFPDGTTGLVGRNGAGKSTLVRLITGELVPTSGSVSGHDSIGYLPQDLVLDPSRTVGSVLGVECILHALARIDAGAGEPADFETVGDRWEVEHEIAVVLASLGFGAAGGRDPVLALDQTIATVSGGEAMLLALAGLFLQRPDVLVLDEPTNNLDALARRRFADAVGAWAGPVIMISHDRDLLDRCDQIAELRECQIRFYGGNFTAYTEALAIEQESARRAVRSAESDLKRQQRELAAMRTKLERRQRNAASQQGSIPKMAADFLQNKSQQAAGKLKGDHEAEVTRAKETLAESEELVRDDDTIDIRLPATRVPTGRDVLVTSDLVLRNGLAVDLHLRGPDRVAVVGPNGIGKTTLVETIMGALTPVSGTVDLRVPVRLLPQRLRLLDDDVPVITTVSRLAPSADDNALRSQLAKFLLSATMIARPAGTLSGGERFRASLAGLLLAEPAPQLLILDEPTNNLDLDSVAQLVSALRGFEGALLVVSHDQQFLDALDLTTTIDLARSPRSDPELAAAVS